MIHILEMCPRRMKKKTRNFLQKLRPVIISLTFNYAFKVRLVKQNAESGARLFDISNADDIRSLDIPGTKSS